MSRSNWNKHHEGKTVTEQGYGHAWRKLREAVFKRDKGLCVPCKRENRITVATEVDHIIEKADGGTDDLGNLQSICKLCHTAKTNRKRMAGCDASGMPLNPEHHWNS